MLRLEDVSLKLGEFRLREISLHIEAGSYLALLGPTGTGKTVLLETIAGMYAPDSGRISIMGRDVTRLAPEKRRLGIVYQDYALFPHLDVFQNIAFGLRLQGKPRREIRKSVEEMADFLEIGALLKRRPIRLSGGERQRVALARALVMKPYVLLLDEPLSALDGTSRRRLQKELKRIHTELGVTIIHITHDVSEALLLADRLAVMKEGRLLQEGAPEEVCGRPKNRSVAELMRIENLVSVTVEGDRLVTGFGDMDLRKISTAGPGNLPRRLCLILPAWSVEPFPVANPQDYFWRGNLRISHIHRMNGTGIVELILSHDGGENLKTRLSRREAESYLSSTGVGEIVPVGLLARGAHLAPEEDQE